MATLRIGRLEFHRAAGRHDLLATPVATALITAAEQDRLFADVTVTAIDPELADTAAFCATYDVPPEISANCVVVAGKRDGQLRIAACVVLATTRADVNGVVRRLLDVRKASFLSMDEAVELSGMEYGGITPLGLPPEWPIFVDEAVAELPWAIIGSGIRGSKIAISGPGLAALAALSPGGIVDGLARINGPA